MGKMQGILQGKFERVTHYTTVQDYSDSYKGYMTDWLKMLKMFQGRMPAVL